MAGCGTGIRPPLVYKLPVGGNLYQTHICQMKLYLTFRQSPILLNCPENVKQMGSFEMDTDGQNLALP